MYGPHLLLGYCKCRWPHQTVRVPNAWRIYSNFRVLFHSAVANALITGSVCVGGIIGPQTFQARDAPQYIPAKISVLATQSTAILVAIIIRLYYGWQNSRKEKAAITQKTIKDIEWLNCKSTLFKLGDTMLIRCPYSYRQRKPYFPISVLDWDQRQDVGRDIIMFLLTMKLTMIAF